MKTCQKLTVKLVSVVQNELFVLCAIFPCMFPHVSVNHGTHFPLSKQRMKKLGVPQGFFTVLYSGTIFFFSLLCLAY